MFCAEGSIGAVEKRRHLSLVYLSIGQLAKATGATVKTLRYWTTLGLLEADRGENGYRYYREDVSQRIAFIRSAQEFGFTLSEIQDILALRASGVKPCEHVRTRLNAHLVTVRTRIAELESLEKDLEARLTWAEAHPEPECLMDGCVYLAAD
jgi:DNA-binding transcriptional MerR regulator